MRLPEIIGVSGTNGSGKDTLAELRAEKENSMPASLSDILRVHQRENGLPCEREDLANLSRQWREDYDNNGILVTKTIERYEEINQNLAWQALRCFNGLSVVSLRHPAEADEIHKHGGLVIWTESDPRISFERISNSQRGRVDDDKTFEQFVAELECELLPAEGVSSGTVNLGAVRPLADEIIFNNFDTKEEYIAYLAERFELG